MNRQQITENLNRMHEIAQKAHYQAQAAISAYDAYKEIMIRFNVTVRTSCCRYAYSAIHKCAADAIADAVDLFGPCFVSVRPE